MTWRKSAGMEHEIERLKAEVERLREERDKDDAVIVYQHTELERLRKSDEIQLLELERLREGHAKDTEQWFKQRDTLQAEVERLRTDAEKWRSTVADAEKTYAYVARLHRIEEAARVFVDNQPGTRLAPEFEAAWIDLRAALEEEA